MNSSSFNGWSSTISNNAPTHKYINLMFKIQKPLIYFKITDEMSEWIYSVCLWSIKPARFDHDSYHQCKKSNLIINQSKIYLCFQLKDIHQPLIPLIVKKPLSKVNKDSISDQHYVQTLHKGKFFQDNSHGAVTKPRVNTAVL